MNFNIHYIYGSVIILLLSLTFFLFKKGNSDRITFQNELSKQAIQTAKVDSGNKILTKSYVELNNDLNKKLQELNGKNTLIKRLFGDKTALEDSVKKLDLKITGLIKYTFSVELQLKNLQAKETSKGIFTTNYKDNWVAVNLGFDLNKKVFNVDSLSIKNDITLLYGKQENNILTVFAQNANPYADHVTELKVFLPEDSYVPGFYEKYKLYFGIAAGLTTGYLIFK